MSSKNYGNSRRFDAPKNPETNDNTIVVVSYDYSLVSTARLLDLERFGITLKELPKRLQKFVREHVIPKDLFNPFHAIEKAVRDYLDSIGAPSYYGRVISPARAKEAKEKMVEFQQRWEEAFEELKVEYPIKAANAMAELENHPDLQDFAYRVKFMEAVRSAQPSWDYVENHISFNYYILAMGSVSHYDPVLRQQMEDGLVAVKKGCFGRLLQDVCKTANEILGLNQKGGKRTVDRVRDLASRLRDLAFLDKRLRVLADGMDDILDAFPPSGALDGAHLDDFITLLMVLKNQKLLVEKLDRGEPPIKRVDAQQPALDMPDSVPAAASVDVENKVGDEPAPKPEEGQEEALVAASTGPAWEYTDGAQASAKESTEDQPAAPTPSGTGTTKSTGVSDDLSW